MNRELDYLKPFMVKVIEDCRYYNSNNVKNLSGESGICLGLYDYSVPLRKNLRGTPLIKVKSEYIWGIECWWTPENELYLSHKVLKKSLDIYKKSKEYNFERSLEGLFII